MESEPEGEAPDSKLKPSARRRAADQANKNESVPENWARKPHTSDRIPIPSTTNIKFSKDQTRVILEDETSYGQNDFIFVAVEPQTPPTHRDDISYAVPKAFRIARIISFEKEKDDSVNVRVNWLYRPAAVAKHPENSRELYLTFETGVCKITDFRGKCTVSNKAEIRNISRFCDKPSQFWFSHLYDQVTRRLYAVLPVASLKSLGPEGVDVISRTATSVVVEHEHIKKLCEPHRKRKHSQAHQPSPEAEPELPNTSLRNEWPFRFYDVITSSVAEAPGIPDSSTPSVVENKNTLTSGKHIDVSDWPGKPLAYYTLAAQNPALGKSQRLRLLEASNDEEMWNVDTSLPWVQQMPQGYIARGSDVTATKLSLPHPNISHFIEACQENYAAKLGVKPYNLNFIDACCQAFTANDNDENKALIEVSRFTRRSIGEPELTPVEEASFEAAMNPFLKHSWHEVFQAVKTKPISDLSQYLWTQRPDSAVTPAEDQFWETDPEPGTEGIQCAICMTEEAAEWRHLPGYVPIPATSSTTKKALCSRCARLWYRYQINWLPFTRVDELENEGQYVEAELVEDAKAVKAEDERREKRRVAAQEKKEALVRRREEAKQAKAEAKAAGKSNKATPRKKVKQESVEAESLDQENEADTSTVQEVPVSEPAIDTQEDKVEEDAGDEPQEDSEAESTVQVARRRPNSTQLTLNSIDDDFLNTLSEDLPPELSSVPQNCVVCGQLDVSMSQQTCASCGLKVHKACYGPGRYKGQGPWLCDCCVNGRSGLGLDSFYQCALCPPRQPTYLRWLNGDPVGANDVLKGTVDKTWCHLRCAVWIDGVTFLSPDNLDGIDMGKVGTGTSRDQCSICLSRIIAEPHSETNASSSGSNPKSNGAATNAPDVKVLASMGVCAKCDVCHDTFHVSCAAEKSYTFGFTKAAAVNERRAVIRCARHGPPSPDDLRPMSYVDLVKGTTVLEEYVQHRKKSTREGTITAAERANMAADQELCLIAGESGDSALIVGTTGLLVGSRDIKCAECRTSDAPYWLSTNVGHVCPLCYRGIRWHASPLTGINPTHVQQEIMKLVDSIYTGGAINS